MMALTPASGQDSAIMRKSRVVARGGIEFLECSYFEVFILEHSFTILLALKDPDESFSPTTRLFLFHSLLSIFHRQIDWKI